MRAPPIELFRWIRPPLMRIEDNGRVSPVFRRPSWWIIAAVFLGCFLGSFISHLVVDYAWMSQR